MKEIKLPTVDIKGKKYVLIKDRLKAFRQYYPEYRATTEILFRESAEYISLPGEEKPRKKEAEICIMATISDPNGNIMATGIAHEKANFTNVNKTSYIENCETSALGRALAVFGVGIDDSISSADELVNAIQNQK